jgi:two-component system OmpR family sensor kinase
MPGLVGRGAAQVRSVAGRGRRLYARTPLRVRLVAALLVLVVAALIGAGAAATTTMQAYLVGRVDAQLQEVAEHPVSGLAAAGSMPGREREDGPADDDRSHLPSAYVIEVLDARGGIVYGPTSNLVDTQEPLPRLPHLTVPTDGGTRSSEETVEAVSGDGRWRVAVRSATLSDGSPGTLLVAQSLGDVQNTVGRLMLLFAVIGGVAVLLIAGLGYLVVRASLRPLEEVERTAAAIARGDLSQRVPPIDPRTEIGQLSAALNTMLAEIEVAFAERAASEQAARRSEQQVRASEAAARRSEDRMRRFVADASHELRTPLTTIRGFAELYRQGAAAEPEDVRRLMRRIEDEAARMGLLVEDLLLLARLDQQRPLARTPVDLLVLAADAVHDAQAVEPSHPIRLDVGPIDPPPVVTGDEPRLRQVLANLLGNAVLHTPAGTPVTVRVATEPGRGTGVLAAVLTVSDEGPGLTAEHAARVFERFYRADPSRGRADGGTGLGLAIVAALVAGHGGTVDVDAASGRGARFRVELPLAPLPAGSAQL